MGGTKMAAGGWPGAAGQACLLALVLVLGACDRRAQEASEVPHTPIPKVEPTFSMEVRQGRIAYGGVVADAATRSAVAAALQATPGATGTVKVDPRTLPARWVEALGPASEALRQSGGRLDIAGRRIDLRGDLDAERRATLHARLQRLYPGYTLAGGLAGVDPRLALPEAGNAGALLAFLNAVPLSFHPDSGMLSDGGVDAVARAVRGLQAAGPTAQVEALVHPDAAVEAEGAAELARQRIDALQTQFALRGVAPPQLVVRPGPFLRGREGQVEFVAPAPPAPVARP